MNKLPQIDPIMVESLIMFTVVFLTATRKIMKIGLQIEQKECES